MVPLQLPKQLREEQGGGGGLPAGAEQGRVNEGALWGLTKPAPLLAKVSSPLKGQLSQGATEANPAPARIICSLPVFSADTQLTGTI